MHAPVSNGIQAAYFVAACVTGLIAGALAVTFADITEGLGCFLGGFCLSMWFLILKPGGLIPATAGKVIFIACLTVGAFALYTSHHTRPYGIIGSTSVAGSTVIVLGVDCFSRAGLKEFWLYIWSKATTLPVAATTDRALDLNSNIFPPNYNGPYPITRGIRVETAAIVIITLIGVMSQLKIWQIVKQKKEERAAEQQKKEHQRNLSDEEQGRKVENQNQQDRPLWEAMHGSKDTAKVQERFLDSAIGTDEPSSTRKGSLSDAEGMEMQDLKDSQNGSNAGGRVTVHVAQDDFYDIPLAGGEHSADSLPRLSGDSRNHGQAPAIGGFSTPSSKTSAGKENARASNYTVDPNLTLRPKVVPPPFKVPETDSSSDDENSSVAAYAASDQQPDRLSKRLSGFSIMRKLSNRSQRSYIARDTSDEALIVPHEHHDRASSRAATFDGLSDKDLSSEDLNYSRGPSPTFNKRNSQASLNALVAAAHNMRNPTSDPDYIYQAVAVPLPRSRPASFVEHRPNVVPPSGRNGEAQAAPETPTQRTAHPNLAAENLPSGGSKIVTAYRTNEWAKHLGGAETPQIDRLKVNKLRSPEITQGESAAPVNIRALQQTPLNAEPAPVLNNTATLPSAKHHASNFAARNPFSRKQKSEHSRPDLHPLTIAKQIERSPSQTSLAKSMSRTSSQTSLNSNGSRKENYRPPLPRFRSSQSSIPPMRNHRSSSTPLTSPLVESPIEEGVESSFPARFTPQPTHLMSQRDRIITSKPSSTSLLRTSYSNVALDQHPAYRSLEEDDNISLAQRKSLLKQQPPAMSMTHRSSSGPLGTTTPRYASGTATPYRSASGASTPQRLSSGPNPSLYPLRPAFTPRDSTISAWRTSLQPNATAHLQDQEIDRRRSELLAMKRKESTGKQELQFAQGVRASVQDKGMRRPDMMQAHKEAMRRMQEGVKL